MTKSSATKIAFVGDVHVGNHKRFGGPRIAGVNRRCDQVLNALNEAAMHAATNSVDAFVILGDLFDAPNPNPQILRRVQDIVETVPAIILAGNHDQCSDAPRDNALGPLAAVCDVVDSPELITIGDTDLLLVPYQSGNCREWLPEQTAKLLKNSNSKNKVLCFHAGIIGKGTPEFLKTADAAITAGEVFSICADGGIETAFAGHWHNKKVWDFKSKTCETWHKIVQAGALVPTGWNNPGLDYGTIFYYRTTPTPKVTTERVNGPRFIDALLDDEISSFAEDSLNLNMGEVSLYARLHVAATEVALGNTILKAGIDSEVLCDGELVISKKEADEATVKAARETQSSETLEAALEAFVSLMALKHIDDFDAPEARDEIKEKVLEYMDTQTESE